MRITGIEERTIPLSRYADPAIPSGGLTTSLIALRTDVERSGKPVVGYGCTSIGRFAQAGLIRERFAPRLLLAARDELLDEGGTNFDPLRAWAVLMRDEKPGGHGERCVAAGALDMALWDAAAKVAGLPLHRFLARRLGRAESEAPVRVYAGGGYVYPRDDLSRLRDEIASFLERGYTHVKIKVGGAPLDADRRRIEATLELLASPAQLAVDAMNRYDATSAPVAARAFEPYGLWWFEDVCDPLDFDTLRAVAQDYPGPIACGEALFSAAEARLLERHGGLRAGRDILQFDPAHCYGLSEYLHILEIFERAGWARDAFWPHGGHLFTLHVVAALGLGGAEVNPDAFAPVGGLTQNAVVAEGATRPPEVPGIGFEERPGFLEALARL